MIANCKLAIANCKLNKGCQMKPDDLSERLLDFAARMGNVGRYACPTRGWAGISRRNSFGRGTSAGPNYEEGSAAESRADFIHKLSICLKELRESRFWLRLIIKIKHGPQDENGGHLGMNVEQLMKIIGKSITTAKCKTPKRI